LGFDEADFRERVAALRPTHAVVQFGSEIALGRAPWAADAFEAALRQLLERLGRADVVPVLTTGYPIGSEHTGARRRLEEYDARIEELARERGCRLADVGERLRAARARGVAVIAPSGRIPTFDGHREIAAAVLAAFGYGAVAVPRALELALLPGTVTDWRVRVASGEPALDASRLPGPAEVDAWSPLRLPTLDPFANRVAQPSHTITYRDRARGFATHLTSGPDESVVGFATVRFATAREAWLNSGAMLRRVWLNGELVYDSGGRWTGWHAGKERVPVRLREGANEVVIEAGDSFFVSLTDERDWALPSGGREDRAERRDR